MLKLVNVSLLGILIGLIYLLGYSNKNYFDLLQLEKTATTQKLENFSLLARNQKLLAEVIDLKNDGETIETIARFELGLIKAGETFYQIVE